MGPAPQTLGIETSCDETAVAVLDCEGRVEFDVLSSQVASHAPFGGVVPELASREHLKALPWLVDKALENGTQEIALVAVTAGPGLVGALLVGVRFASAFAWARDLPMVAVDHLDGHQASPFLRRERRPAKQVPPRVLALVASGGHSAWYLSEHGVSTRLRRTRDDAAGESFDKVGKVLGLPYPGGPVIDRLARRGCAERGLFRQPKIKDGSNDLSFSGLKSAAIREARQRGLEGVGEAAAGPEMVNLLASFESAVIRQLLGPMKELVHEHRPDLVTISGGVAANSALRRAITDEADRLGVALLIPEPCFTTDNAAMIARAGQLGWLAGRRDDPRRLDARTREIWHPPGMRRKLDQQARGAE